MLVGPEKLKSQTINLFPVIVGNILSHGLRKFVGLHVFVLICTQPAVTCSKLKIETLEQGVKYFQS